MINTVSDFLLNLMQKEKELLIKYKIIDHPGIIGSMYEGLSKEILSRSLFPNLDLRVSAGKIRSIDGDFSSEIDCMIVIGEGENIPYTDKYIYNAEQVIAVIEIKKNLYTKELIDSYNNLLSVKKTTKDQNPEEYHGRLLRDSWRTAFREEVPERKNLDSLPKEKQAIYHSFLMEAIYPARIVWGYNGFSSEFSFRSKFLQFLKKNKYNETKKNKFGFGPVSFPSLIICDNFSMIKLNGVPFMSYIENDYYWPFYSTSNFNPLYFLIEIIWTRISYKFRFSYQFSNQEMTNEVHGFLLCRYHEESELRGWNYYPINTEKEFLAIPIEQKEWEPQFINKVQYLLLAELCQKLEMKISNCIELNENFIQQGTTISEVAKSLKHTGFIHFENNYLKLITASLMGGATKDGRIYIGDNKNDQVVKWKEKNL